MTCGIVGPLRDNKGEATRNAGEEPGGEAGQQCQRAARLSPIIKMYPQLSLHKLLGLRCIT